MPLLSTDAETIAHRNPKRKRGHDDAPDSDNDAPGLRPPVLLPSSAPSLPSFSFQTPSSSAQSPSPSTFTYQIPFPFPFPSPSLSLSPSSSPSFSSSSYSSQPAPRKHTSRACVVCREKKCKCDGNVPVCGPCGVHGRQCSYSLKVDKRVKDSAEQANQRILMLEAEKAQLIEHYEERIRVLEAKSHNLGQGNNVVGAHRPPALTLTVLDPDLGGGGGSGGGGAFRSPSPLTSASSDSSSFPWSTSGSPSPWSSCSSLPSPLPQHPGQYLEVPKGLHGGRYSTKDELARDGQMGLPVPDVYGESLVGMQEDAAAPLMTTTWAGSTGGVGALATSLSAMNFNATDSQAAMNVSAMPFDATENLADSDIIGPAFPDSGPGLIAPGDAVPEHSQMYDTLAGGFDVNGGLLLDFMGSPMDPAYRNEE